MSTDARVLFNLIFYTMVTNLNQVRHLYVAKNVVDALGTDAKAGDIAVKSIGTIEKELYFMVQGADTALKSDYIPVKSIVDARAKKASEMATIMKKVTVSLSADVNSGAPIVGQDYILRISFRQFYGMSDQDQYFKDAAVHVTKSISTAEEFYKAMVTALNLSFSRELGATKDSNPYLKFTATATGIEIEELPQKGHLGTQAEERVLFEVYPTTVYDGTDDVVWGTLTTDLKSGTKVGNGFKIADLEYFLLGERGDQYRKIGWPNDIETKGVADSTGATDYDTLDIHYSFSGSGVNSYKTEKDLTIVAPADGQYTVINAVIAKINEVTGLSIEALSD